MGEEASNQAEKRGKPIEAARSRGRGPEACRRTADRGAQRGARRLRAALCASTDILSATQTYLRVKEKESTHSVRSAQEGTHCVPFREQAVNE